MRIRNVLTAVFLMMLMLQAPCVSLAAEEGASGQQETLVFDMAGLFTDVEREELEDAASALSERMGMEAAVATVNDNPDTAQVYADRFYQDQNLGTGTDHSGVMLLLDMDNREIYITTEGRMLRYLTDSRIEAVLDDVYVRMTEGEYGQAAMAFLEDVGICYDNGIAGDQYLYDTETGRVRPYRHISWYEALIAFVIAAVCAGGAVFAVIREYRMDNDNERMAANFKLSYRKDSAFRPGISIPEVLLGTYVTQQVIASTRNRNTGSGGRRSGGSLSGGGRTSTHTYRGRTHGGGGRKF